MRIAFYAPMKPPDHPVPSGDRQIARALMQALAAAGHEVRLASRLRSFDARGDGARQERLARLGEALAARFVAAARAGARTPDLWFTYHLYHKAPDWIGPSVARVLAIPYVVAEASVAAKQSAGPWRRGYASSVEAVRQADAVIALNPDDIAGVRRVRGGDLVDRLPPFIDVAAWQRLAGATDAAAVDARLGLARGSPRLVAVAMMREGAKLASYRLLAAALANTLAREWHLVVVGDGPARAEVESAFAGFPAGRVRWVGAQPPEVLAPLLASADLLAWPAIDEAFGIAPLEAQACGLPVVAGRDGGVAEVVAHGRTGLLVAPGDADAFAGALGAMLDEPAQRARMARAAPAYVRERHDVTTAAARLDAILARVRAARREA